MSVTSSIEWTDATWNPTRGCTKIAQGCKNCYAETFAERFRGVAGHPYEQGFDPRLAPDQLTLPLKWRKPRRIFVDSMSDLFHEAFSFDYIAAVFGVMAKANWHTYQVLTKRPERAAQFLNEYAAGGRHVWEQAQKHEVRDFRYAQNPSGWPLPNIWIGTSIAEQKDAERNIPHLLTIPAAVRFLSVEPLIGPVTFPDYRIFGGRDGIHWVIVGGESGPGARACGSEWVRSIVEECQSAGVPVFVKQLGAKPFSVSSGTFWRSSYRGGFFYAKLNDRKGGDMQEWPADLRVRLMPGVSR